MSRPVAILKIIVTGGAGFIGSHVVDRLLDQGNHVVVIDNYSTGKVQNNTAHDNLVIAKGTVADYNFVKGVFQNFSPDIVIHAAAAYSDPNNWEEDIATNILGTVNIIRAAKAHDVRRLIYLQTSLCYGLNPLEQPITLSHPFFSGAYSGGSSYAISKTAGEMYIELSGLEFVSFRLANTYGPRNMTGPLPAFYLRIDTQMEITITDTRRDFIYVDDVVNCILLAAEGNGKKGYYHLSTGKDHSIQELFEETVKYLDIKYEKIKIVEKGKDDVFTILIDPQKTQRDFGWNAEVSLVQGIAKSIEYYKTHGLEKTYTHLKNINE
jgi:UDP-glucose 4-epimerase